MVLCDMLNELLDVRGEQGWTGALARLDCTSVLTRM